MRIAFFAALMTDTPWGGSEELWHRTARLALEHGHQVAVVSFGWPEVPPKLRELRERGARLLALGHFRSWYNARSLRWRLRWKLEWVTVWGALASWGPDVVCVSQGGTYDLVEHRAFVRFLDRHRTPYIVISQYNSEDVPLAGEPQRRSAIEYLSKAHRVAFVAEGNLRAARRQLGAGLPNARVVRNPLNLSDFRPVPYPRSDLPSMAVVARLQVWAKGQDVLLEALGGDAWKGRPWRLRFYGDGGDRAYLERLARYYGIGEKVDFRGHVGDVRSIWAENHLMVMPSRSEGTPLALVEAMTCARAAVATDVGGNAEWVAEPDTGFLAEAASARSLGAALGRAWDARDAWEEIGRRAHEAAAARIDPHPDETILAMIAEAAAGGPGTPGGSTPHLGPVEVPAIEAQGPGFEMEDANRKS
jgi:glycosyltransferase involved in cell wall biosynthesis